MRQRVRMPTPSECFARGFSTVTSSIPSSYSRRRSSRLICRVERSRASKVALPSATSATRGASACGSASPRASYVIRLSPTAAIGAPDFLRSKSRRSRGFRPMGLPLPYHDLALVGVVGVDLALDDGADGDLLRRERDDLVRLV